MTYTLYSDCGIYIRSVEADNISQAAKQLCPNADATVVIEGDVAGISLPNDPPSLFYITPGAPDDDTR